MSYRKVEPRMWDDERFAALSPEAKLTWLCILTGPHTTALPGLSVCGVASLAEAIRYGIDTVSKALDELVAKGLVKANLGARVILVPNAPRYNPCPNVKVLKGWLSLWKNVPDCAEKYAYIKHLRASLDFSQEWSATAWGQTFDTVSVPSRYGIDTVSNSVAVAATEPPTEVIVPFALAGSADHDPKSTLGETTEGQRQTDENAPGEAPDAQPAGVVAPKPSAGAVEPPALSLTLDEPARGKRRTAKPEAPPPPFGIGEAFEALASSALGRFSAGTPRDWTKGHRIAVAKAIRAYPTLDEWSVLGAWLAAGGDRYRGTLSVAWAASNALPDAMARARDWHAQGRPALDGHRPHSAPQVPATVPLSSSPYSAPKPLPEGVKSPSQIIRERQAAIAARRAEAERGTH